MLRINFAPRTLFLRLFIKLLMNMESFRPHWLPLRWCERRSLCKSPLTTASLTFQVRALYSPCFPLQQAHSINHSAALRLYSAAAKTPMSVAVRMNSHDSANSRLKAYCFCFLFPKQIKHKKNKKKTQTQCREWPRFDHRFLAIWVTTDVIGSCLMDWIIKKGKWTDIIYNTKSRK